MSKANDFYPGKCTNYLYRLLYQAMPCPSYARRGATGSVLYLPEGRWFETRCRRVLSGKEIRRLRASRRGSRLLVGLIQTSQMPTTRKQRITSIRGQGHPVCNWLKGESLKWKGAIACILTLKLYKKTHTHTLILNIYVLEQVRTQYFKLPSIKLNG